MVKRLDSDQVDSYGAWARDVWARYGESLRSMSYDQIRFAVQEMFGALATGPEVGRITAHLQERIRKDARPADEQRRGRIGDFYK